jgi:hypothetical protein
LSSGVTRSIVKPGSSANGEPGGKGCSCARSGDGGVCCEAKGSAVTSAIPANPSATVFTGSVFITPP